MLTLRRDIVAGSSIATDAVLSFGGALVILLATQISINLPFTPVPITGQTFGVITAAMLLGRARGVAAVLMYLTAGLAGMPVFANFSSLNAFFGPTAGYLIAFVPAAFVAGYLAERGWTLSYLGAITIGLIAHTIILGIGSIVVASYFGITNAWSLGIEPFLIGEGIKSVVAAVIVHEATRRRKAK